MAKKRENNYELGTFYPPQHDKLKGKKYNLFWKKTQNNKLFKTC